MRESIGGAILIKIVMYFIAIYVCFLGIGINYAITFRVKNQIINLIEAYEGYDNAKSKIQDYIASVGYNRTSVGSVALASSCGGGVYTNGYCIQELTSDRGKYYKVTTYVSFDFPIIGQITNFPVSGETKVIYNL